jgi:TolA-binding protein
MDPYELEEIKREIVESRSLSIKTNNLVNALAADLKSLARRQQGAERRSWLNTATAYVVTTLLILVAVKIAWDLKLDAIRAETKDSLDKLAQTDKDLKSALGREERMLRSSRQAAEFYKLVEQHSLKEVVEGFPQIAKLELTPTERGVFEAAYAQAKNQLSFLAYQSGLEHVRSRRWQEAEEAMRDSLRYKDNAVHTPQASYHLALALTELGNFRDAIVTLAELAESSTDKEVLDDATLLLARAQLRIEAYNDAKNTLRSFIRRFPSSPFLNDARALLAKVQLEH